MNLSKSGPVERQFSMGFSHFCVSCKERHWQLPPQKIFSKISVEHTALRIKKVSLEQKSGVLTLQSQKDNVSLWGKGWAVCLQLVVKKMGLLKRGVPHLFCKTTVCAASTWESMTLMLLSVSWVIKFFFSLI